MEYNSLKKISAAGYSTGKLHMEKKSSVKKLSFEAQSAIDNTGIVTCDLIHTVKYEIIISYVFEENCTSCDTIMYKIFVFHLSGAFLHQGKRIAGKEEPETGIVVKPLQIFSLFIVESQNVHIGRDLEVTTRFPLAATPSTGLCPKPHAASPGTFPGKGH